MMFMRGLEKVSYFYMILFFDCKFTRGCENNESDDF